MILKPPRWNISPALVSPEARSLMKGVAFIAPLWDAAGGKGALLNSFGQPLSGSNLVAGSTAEKRATPYGLGVGISGASNLLYQDNFIALPTSNGVGTGDFTVVCLANPPAEAAISNAIGQNVSGLQPRLDMFFNAASIAASSGSFELLTRNATNVFVDVAGVIDGKYHLFGGSRNGGNVRAWVDGLLRASTSNTVQNIAGTGGGFAIGSRAESTATRINTATTVVFVAGWNRALSTAEMRLLALDPFIMMRMAAVSPSLWAAAGAYFLNADPASFGITGVAAGAVAGRMVAADAAAYALTGFNSAIPAGRAIAADPASYAITGVPAGVIADRVIDAAPASFSITGIDAGILAGRALSADPAALVITGVAADLVATTAGAFSLNADPASFDITGINAGTIASRILDTLAGSYDITGLAASVVAGRALSADPTVYTIIGTDADVVAGRVITADPGVLAVTGTAADLVYTIAGAYSLHADPAVFSITGVSADVVAARLMAADPGAYVITGLTATLETGLGVQTYAAQILILDDAREIIIIGDPLEMESN